MVGPKRQRRQLGCGGCGFPGEREERCEKGRLDIQLYAFSIHSLFTNT